VHHVDIQIKFVLINFEIYKTTWALQWQPQGKFGLHDTQIGPPICACTPSFFSIICIVGYWAIFPQFTFNKYVFVKFCKICWQLIWIFLDKWFFLHYFTHSFSIKNVNLLQWILADKKNAFLGKCLIYNNKK
jgi:hypothetical protein